MGALQFARNNKVFTGIVVAGVLVIGGVVVTPLIQDATSSAQPEETATPAPESTRASETGTPVEETPSNTSTEEPGVIDPGEEGYVAPDRTPAQYEYENTGEGSPRANQAYLPAGDPNPVDDNGDPIDYFGTKMDDPMPVAEEFAKQWANPDGGADAWRERLHPLLSDQTIVDFEVVTDEQILDLELTGINMEKNPAFLASNFYRFTASYEGCGEVLIVSMTPHPEGSWLINTIQEAQQSTPANRGNGCFFA